VLLYDCITIPQKSRRSLKASYCILYSITIGPHQQLGRTSDMKFFVNSVSVQEGETFSIPEQSFIYKKESVKGYIGCFKEGYIDGCEINYSNFYSLQVLGVLHVSNIRHLKCIPTTCLKKDEYLTQVIITLLNHVENKELPLERIPEEFRRWTRRDMEKCYKVYDDRGFYNARLYQMYPEHFDLSLDLKPKIKLKEYGLKGLMHRITFPSDYNKKGRIESTPSTCSEARDSPCLILDEESHGNLYSAE